MPDTGDVYSGLVACYTFTTPPGSLISFSGVEAGGRGCSSVAAAPTALCLRLNK